MRNIKVNFYVERPSNPVSVIVCKFSYNGKLLSYYTGISVNPKDWSKAKMRVDHRKEMAWEINDRINDIEKAVNNVLISFQKNVVENLTSKQVKFAVDA